MKQHPYYMPLPASAFHKPDPPILEELRRSHGYITDEQIPELATAARLTPVLVRCGGGRFTCAAQDVEHFIAIIERDGQDYVRDVQLARR